MSTGFRAIQWGDAKKKYDAILIACVAAFIIVFVTIGYLTKRPTNVPDEIDIYLEAFGVAAFLMITVILCIGPLARIDRRFLPLLYNRRHFGVMAFVVAAIHAWLMIEWYLAQGNLSNLVGELTTWEYYFRFIGFPFKVLGIIPLTIMFLMAATSHDFWLQFLGPRVWKWLHMSLYVAYGLVIMHVALGLMQRVYSPVLPGMLIVGGLTVAVLHLIAGLRERRTDTVAAAVADGWLRVGAPSSIPDQAARIVVAPGGERIAVYRDGKRVAAVTNLCAHQQGPLGEGRIIDGCITCPWHGYQYRLEDGCAPPPFTEKLATYPVRLRDGIVEVSTSALPPGTPASIQIA